VVVAAVLAWGYLRIREPRVIRGLRAIHTGSANDYAAYAIAGTLAAIAVLSLG
jgi:multicomponent Na+:H+ antiporter subunit D